MLHVITRQLTHRTAPVAAGKYVRSAEQKVRRRTLKERVTGSGCNAKEMPFDNGFGFRIQRESSVGVRRGLESDGGASYRLGTAGRAFRRGHQRRPVDP